MSHKIRFSILVLLLVSLMAMASVVAAEEPGVDAGAAGEVASVEFMANEPTNGFVNGESFTLEVHVKDIRSADQSVFAAYMDVLFDPSHLQVNSINYNATNFSYLNLGTIDNPNGVVNEVGATSGNFTAGGDMQVFALDMQIVTSDCVTSTVGSEVSEDLISQVVLYGLDTDERANTLYNSLDINLNPCGIGIPDVYAPTGAVTSADVTFEWEDIGADYYDIYVSGPGGITEQRFQPDACTAGTCSATLNDLHNGYYSWFVRGGDNTDGDGDWSTETFFSVELTPGVPQITGPSASTFICDAQPTITWDYDPSIDWYQIYVGTDGSTAYNDWVQWSNVCDNGTCSLDLAGLGVFLNTTWYNVVGVGYNEINGYSSQSSDHVFTVSTPWAPTPQTPAEFANVETAKPTFTWDALDCGETTYKVFINDAAGNVLYDMNHSKDDLCAGGTCTFDAAFYGDNLYMPGHYYQYFMQAFSSAGNGAVGGGWWITVDLPPTIVNPISPAEGSVATSNTPSFTFGNDPHSHWYNIWVCDANSSCGENWWQYTDANLVCNATECSVPYPFGFNLADGAAQWWLRSWSPGDNGGNFADFAGPVNFTVSTAMADAPLAFDAPAPQAQPNTVFEGFQPIQAGAAAPITSVGAGEGPDAAAGGQPVLPGGFGN